MAHAHDLPPGSPNFLLHPDVFPDANEPGMFRVRVCRNCQASAYDCICDDRKEDIGSLCPIIYRHGQQPKPANDRLLKYLHGKHTAHDLEKAAYKKGYTTGGDDFDDLKHPAAEMRARTMQPTPEQQEQVKIWHAELHAVDTAAAPVVASQATAAVVLDRYALVPAELKALERWGVYKMIWNEDAKKFDKPPYNAVTHRKGNPIDPENRTTFSIVRSALASHTEYNGPGFGLDYSDGLTAIDIDDCVTMDVTKHTIEPWAEAIVTVVNTYTEISPSGKGLRLWLRGWQVPIVDGKEGRNFGGIEIYSGKRYLTVTGQHVAGTPLGIETRDITGLFTRCDRGDYTRKTAATPGAADATPPETKDSVQIERTGNVITTKLKLLMSGDITSTKPFVVDDGRGNSVEYPSHSEADQALCNLLAFEGHDAAGIDEQFQESVLMREKWTTHSSYARVTIEKALQAAKDSKVDLNAPIKLTAKDYAVLADDSDDAPAEAAPATVVDAPQAAAVEPDLASLIDVDVTPTHRGIAEVLARLFGKDFSHVIIEVAGVWYRFDGRVWKKAAEPDLLLLVTKLSKRIRKLAVQTTEAKEAAKLIVLANKLDNIAFPKGVITHLCGILKCPIDVFDQKPDLFNFTNGTYDLEQQIFRAADRADRLTQMAKVRYNSAAECPQWLAFLTRCFPEVEIRLYLQRWFGYCLTGKTDEKAMLILHGEGDNGKTILLEIITMVMGSYAEHTQFSSLASSKWQEDGANKARGDMVVLMKARFVKADESRKGLVLDEALIKQVTGGGGWKGRVNYGEVQTYTPIFKLLLATNDPPLMTADDAMRIRVHYIPMPRQFKKGMPGRIEKLKDLLAAELEGIAAWMVEGHKEYAKQGLNPPAQVLDSTRRFHERNDVQAEFFAEICQFRGEILLRDLFAAHQQWAYNTGAADEAKLSIHELEELLVVMKFKIERVTAGVKGRPKIVRGLSLITEADADDKNGGGNKNDNSFSLV